jgi:predicted nuclease with TOPRIM domain
MAEKRSKNFEAAVFEQFRTMELRLTDQFAKIDERFGKLEYALGRLDERMDRLEESQRKLGVGFEDLTDRFNLLLEGYSVLDAKVDRLQHDFSDFRDEVNEKFAAIR